MGIKWLDKSHRSPVSCKEISREQVANRLQSRCKQGLNQLVTNRHSHSYHLDELTFIFRGIKGIFSFSFHFSKKIMLANRIALDGTPLFVASHLKLISLPMFYKKEARLIWVNIQFMFHKYITV